MRHVVIVEPSVFLDWQKDFIDSMKSRGNYKRRLWFNVSNHAMIANRLETILWIRFGDYEGPAVLVEDPDHAYTPHPFGYGHCLPPGRHIISHYDGVVGEYLVYPGGFHMTPEEIDPHIDTYDEFMMVSEDEDCEYDSESTSSSSLEGICVPQSWH